MTRHAEMERPDEVQEAEFAREWRPAGWVSLLLANDAVRRTGRLLTGHANHRSEYDGAREVVIEESRASNIRLERTFAILTPPRPRHRHPYSATADRLKGRHLIRKHRAEVSG